MRLQRFQDLMEQGAGQPRRLGRAPNSRPQVLAVLAHGRVSRLYSSEAMPAEPLTSGPHTGAAQGCRICACCGGGPQRRRRMAKDVLLQPRARTAAVALSSRTMPLHLPIMLIVKGARRGVAALVGRRRPVCAR